MGKIVINGGKRLFGSVCIHGAKNAVLPVMAASLMNEGVTVIRAARILPMYVQCVGF